MPRLRRFERIPFEDLGGGQDEGSPPHKVKFRKCENVRDSAGDLSKIKRPGLTKLDSVYDFGTKNVYGAFGIGEVGTVKELALLEDDIQLKSGGSWSSIFTPTDTIDIPVSIVKEKGLTIVAGYEKPITIRDGVAFYSGIEAPSSLLEVHPEYPGVSDTEDCSSLAAWSETNGGTGNMDAQAVTFDTKSCFKFVQTGSPNLSDYVTLDQSYGAVPGKRFRVKTSLYFDTFQHASLEKFYYTLFYSTTEYFAFSTDGYRLSVNSTIPGNIGNVGIELEEDKWYDLEFYCDAEDHTVDVWITPEGGSRAYYGQYAMDLTGSGTAGDASIYCSGHYVVTTVYMDYLNVHVTDENEESGQVFKYGATFYRSGNYPCESNPTEADVEGDYHYGVGLDDLTAGGTYLRRTSKTVKVEIDGTGTPDTIKVSYDGGVNWATTELPIESEMTLQHGVTLTWGATTGHTSGDFWIIPCRAASIRKKASEITEITQIPTSSESEVDARRLYRTYADLTTYYWLYTIGNNTVTTYNDTLSDSDLAGSSEVSYESYPPPEGADCEIWDEKLWVTGVPDQPEALFKSRTGKLEQFPSPATSFFPLREDETDEIMKAVEYKNNLYPVKVNSIWILTKSGSNIITDKIVRNTGTAAKGSVVATNRGIMMLTNHYKLAVFDGWKMILPKISDKVKKTLDSINKDYAYRSTANHDPDNEIYYLSIPTGSNQHPDTTIVFYYTAGDEKIFIDKYHQYITSISLTDTDQYQRDLLFGTKDGEIYKLDESATKDDTTLISATFLTGLVGSEFWKRLRRLFMNYYVPSEILMEDNFNDNNLAGWTQSGGVTASNQRLQVTIDNGGKDYIRKTSPAQTDITVEFTFCIKSLDTWAAGNYIDFVLLAAAGNVCGVGIRNDGGTTKLRSWYNDDTPAKNDVSPDVEIAIGNFYRLRLRWKASSAVAADDGLLKVWLEGISVVDQSSLDNDTHTITQGDFGNAECSASVDATLYIDDIKASVDKHINLKIYRNVEEEAAFDKDYPGRTPSGGDTDLREFIERGIKLRVPGNYFSLEFSNSEDVSAWEVMNFVLYGRSKSPKKKVEPS